MYTSTYEVVVPPFENTALIKGFLIRMSVPNLVTLCLNYTSNPRFSNQTDNKENTVNWSEWHKPCASRRQLTFVMSPKAVLDFLAVGLTGE